MRHRKAGIKLNRTSSHRKAMFRNMVTSLIKYDQIRTTDAKAKELRRWGDKLVTLAKRGDLHARRRALSIVREREVVKKLFDEAPERFRNVSGGYTRVIKLGRRPGDAATMSLVAFIDHEDKAPKKKKKKTTEKVVAAPTTFPAKTKDDDDQKAIALEEQGSSSITDTEPDSETKMDMGQTDETAGEDEAQTELKTDNLVEEPISEGDHPTTDVDNDTDATFEDKSS